MKFFHAILILIFYPGCFQRDAAEKKLYHGNAGFNIKGVNLVAPRFETGDTVFTPIVNIHANYVALMPYAFTRNDATTVKYNDSGKWWGESVAGIEAYIRMAHSKNLSVMLKPHLWLGGGGYTGHFKAASVEQWRTWEESFKTYTLRFAKIADSLDVEIFCFATEMGTAVKERPGFWKNLIEDIRKVYHGKLTYAANWDDYPQFPYWSQLDFIGIDAYFPLSGEKTPSVKEVSQGWEKYKPGMKALNKELDKQILFTEYGYRNADYNCAEPWNENDSPRNDVAQVNAYTGLYESFIAEDWFAGGFLWKWHTESKRRKLDPDFTPQHTPTLPVIKTWYGK